MDDNKIRNAAGNAQKTVDQKPCFTTSNALVFTNLHNAAAEKAAKAIGIAAGSKELNQFVINSGMSDDGRTISNKNDKMNSKVRFSSSGKFEVGIVLQVNATPLTLVGDDTQAAIEKNKKAIGETRKLILSGLKEYFKWFAGDDGSITEDKLVEFIPDYNGGKVQVKNGQILGIKEYREEMDTYTGGGTGGSSAKVKREKEIDPNHKLRVGYKVGYTITYGGKIGAAKP